MNIEKFMSAVNQLGADFYTGVPDSLLSPFTDFIMNQYGVGANHIVAANEGAAVGLAAGYYLATSKPAVVYMQNSGIGNAVNPICSLLHEKVYAIPVIFIIGWRGEPGTADEPQHIFQGKATLPLLDCLEIPYFVVSNQMEESELILCTQTFKKHIENGQSVAFVVSKSALQNNVKMKYDSVGELSRERTLKIIIENASSNDVFVCTTGKLSREVFEIREQNRTGHSRDFLTVGSMGHNLMIAHGIALAKPDRRIFCLDGDGAAIMHLGSLAVVGVHQPENLVHIVMNNGAHETVGGMPAVSSHLNLSEIALKLGYRYSFRAEDENELLFALNKSKKLEGPLFIEIICNLKSRADLGRPTTTPIQNKNDFIAFLGGN